MNPILEQYNILVSAIKSNPQIERQLLFKVKRLNHIVQMNFVQRHEEGYCARFIIPDKEFTLIFNDIPELTDDNIKKAFKLGWSMPADRQSHMHDNIYYQKLCLLVYHAAKTNNTEFGEFVLRLILFRIWNGRITKLIKWCNPEIMAAAIANCKSRKFKFKQYSTPLDLIQQYYAPTIYAKYKDYMLRDVAESKRLFEQSFHRIKQLFGSGSKPDLETGTTRYTSGLQPFYYAAYENKDKIGYNKSNSESDFDDRITSSNISTLVNNIVTHMTVTSNVYNDDIVKLISSNVKGIKHSKIVTILEKMHQLKYSDYLQDIVELYFRRFSGSSEKDFCSPNYYDKIKSHIVASKNNQDIINLKQLVDLLLDQIFKTDFDKPYTDYMEKTPNQRSQYKMIIYYGIAYNINKVICSN
jgi:hypothetical protein